MNAAMFDTGGPLLTWFELVEGWFAGKIPWLALLLSFLAYLKTRKSERVATHRDVCQQVEGMFETFDAIITKVTTLLKQFGNLRLQHSCLPDNFPDKVATSEKLEVQFKLLEALLQRINMGRDTFISHRFEKEGDSGVLMALQSLRLEITRNQELVDDCTSMCDELYVQVQVSKAHMWWINSDPDAKERLRLMTES